MNDRTLGEYAHQIHLHFSSAFVGRLQYSTRGSPYGQRHLYDAKRSAQAGFGSPDGVKADVYHEANEFCAEENKAVETLNLDVTNSGFARPGNVSLEFRCKLKCIFAKTLGFPRLGSCV